MIHLLNGVNLLFRNYKNRTNTTPTIAIIDNNIFTDFKYFFVLELVSFFENAPAPSEMTK